MNIPPRLCFLCVGCCLVVQKEVRSCTEQVLCCSSFTPSSSSKQRCHGLRKYVLIVKKLQLLVSSVLHIQLRKCN